MFLLGGGLVLVAAFLLSRLSRRGRSTDLGCMSEQWVAEHRANHTGL